MGFFRLSDRPMGVAPSTRFKASAISAGGDFPINYIIKFALHKTDRVMVIPRWMKGA
jgi:hypothetical protein